MAAQVAEATNLLKSLPIRFYDETSSLAAVGFERPRSGTWFDHADGTFKPKAQVTQIMAMMVRDVDPHFSRQFTVDFSVDGWPDDEYLAYWFNPTTQLLNGPPAVFSVLNGDTRFSVPTVKSGFLRIRKMNDPGKLLGFAIENPQGLWLDFSTGTFRDEHVASQIVHPLNPGAAGRLARRYNFDLDMKTHPEQWADGIYELYWFDKTPAVFAFVGDLVRIRIQGGREV